MSQPKFFQMKLQEIPLDQVIFHVYPGKPKGSITLEERLPDNCKCHFCGSNQWMIRPEETRNTLDGGKPFIECMVCGASTHL